MLLGDDFCCQAGAGGSFTTRMIFDNKTFNIPMPPGNNQLSINFSVLGLFTSTGQIACVFDQGGSFSETATNQAGDFTWTEIAGDYIDRKPGIGEGDPFPFTGSSTCTTTREDDFKTLCDNFEFSFNGLAKALAPDASNFFRNYGGDFTMRAVRKVPVQSSTVPTIDGLTGDIPQVTVRFQNGAGGGELRVVTLADAHGTVPAGVEFPVRGTTEIDHGSGPVPFFEGGDERFIDITTDAVLPSRPKIQVCLPMPRVTDPAAVRPVRVLHSEGDDVASRRFVDRTKQVDPTTAIACGQVKSLSKFAVVTTDVCGGGQRQSDGLLTVAGGLIGPKTVVVDGLTDCTQYPANLPKGLRQYCVPDGDSTAGQCTVSLTLGVNRGGCNQTKPGIDPHSPRVSVDSYQGSLTQGSRVSSLTPAFGTLIAALSNPLEATVGPVDLALPAVKKITTYKIKHQLTGIRPGTTAHFEVDKDVLTIQCVDPTQF